MLKSLFHGFIHLAHETFHPIHMCIIHVLNAQHMSAKCTNSQKNDFHLISIMRLWDGMFVMVISYHYYECVEIVQKFGIKGTYDKAKNDNGKMFMRSKCGNNTMELIQYCLRYSKSFFLFHKSKFIQICEIYCNYVNIM